MHIVARIIAVACLALAAVALGIYSLQLSGPKILYLDPIIAAPPPAAEGARSRGKDLRAQYEALSGTDQYSIVTEDGDVLVRRFRALRTMPCRSNWMWRDYLVVGDSVARVPLVPFAVVSGSVPILLLASRWVRRRALRKQGRCEICGYPRAASVSEHCSECGAPW